jgi:transposase-like protein
MQNTKSLYRGHCFPAIVISCAVRWYYRFQLSLRDIEELLFEHGVVVIRNDSTLVRQVWRGLCHDPQQILWIHRKRSFIRRRG